MLRGLSDETIKDCYPGHVGPVSLTRATLHNIARTVGDRRLNFLWYVVAKHVRHGVLGERLIAGLGVLFEKKA